MSAELAKQFDALWQSSDSPPDVFDFLRQHNGSNVEEQVAVLLVDQSRRWSSDQPLRVEDYLQRIPALSADPDRKLQLAMNEFQARLANGEDPSVDEYASRFEEMSDTLRSRLLEILSGQLTLTHTHISNSSVGDQQLGRYRLLRLLGEGAYGRVYLALDEELERRVAIKVPTAERFQGPEDAELYLAEARTVAGLDHPNIVPVHDMGRDDDGSVFVVSKFIEGSTLAERIKQDRPGHEESARLLATMAHALQFAHERRLIHRDVKPDNILLEESSGRAYIADFGLAIREEDYLKDGRIAGTPHYMSPEQVRGEGHRLDGRSDIFALGVVLYELLTGKRPFRGSTMNEVLHKVVSMDPPPPRTLDASIPAELERICLKALSKRTTERYATASELADDLLHWNQSPQPEQQDHQIVPKGLRSFDTDDADFFLDLLPGPRNRSGLPESIQFWKTRIEEANSDKTFSVGLIYGPSGCGKSSLVKAGLLPRLSKDVTAIYVEATPDETETRILHGLRKSLPELPQDLGLVETFSLLRRAEGKKVVVVLDQFEQWLHAHRAEQETELVAALRQCDGDNLQAVVMVRDDFAMAAARLMDSLDIPILQGHNFATVDLFDVDHSRGVLVKFGQAFGKLPAQAGKLSDDEQSFVQSVASGLARDGKVVSVRLALFAEMVKGKPWVPATLEDVGGTEGLGVNFLEETFSSRSANPTHRLHQQAAREVLKALLPEVGSDIKGHMRSHGELLEASGYHNRPGEFNDLLRILDGELRLITPTDPEGFQTESDSDPRSKYYQLTHDYLVPSLREWLTRKQQETRKGRAELKLAERAALWNAKPENRHLPSLLEWASIRTLTEKVKWTEPQRKMMGKAGRLHMTRTAAALVLLLLVGWIGYEANGRFQARALVENLLSAKEDAVLEIVEQMKPYASWTSPLLEQELATEAETAEEWRRQLRIRFALLESAPPAVADRLIGRFRQDFQNENLSDRYRFRAGLALATSDASFGTAKKESWEFLAKELIAANPEEQPAFREYLRAKAEQLVPPLEALFDDSQLSDTERISAASALADFAGDDASTLGRLLSIATPAQYEILYEQLSELETGAGQETLLRLASQQPADNLPPDRRVTLGKQRAGAAITLLRQGAREDIFAALRVGSDPESLTQFVHRCRARGVHPHELLECLDQADRLRQAKTGEARELEDRVMFGLLLALGEFGLKALPESERQPLVDRLAQWYASDPSSTIHGATGWLLRRWGQEELTRKVDGTPVPYSPDRQWYTVEVRARGANPLVPELPGPERSFYFTFVVIPAGEYTIGSPPDEPGRKIAETRHTVRLTRPFAILDREITRAEFEAFGASFSGYEQVSRTGDHAMGGPNWYDAVRFCRWLTQKAGLEEDDQAYPAPDSLDPQQYPRDPDHLADRAPRNWPMRLDRGGFRLATEAEWEIACRAETRSAWSFGGDVALLDRYGWFDENSGGTAHVGRLQRPNLRGLFDVHGNMHEWTHDWYGDFKDPLGAGGGWARVYRGGSWNSPAKNCRSSYPTRFEPTDRYPSLGIRLAAVPRSQGPEAKER